MTPTATLPQPVDSVLEDLDRSRRNGPLQHIQVPACPALLLRLRQAMEAAEPDLTEVAAIAGSDVAMSATLIRRANSALHATVPPVSSVGQAMDRLGLDDTAQVMTTFLVQRAIPVQTAHLKRFWERSARRAAAMATIAAELPGLSTDLAHAFGLFCHVGTPVMLQCVKGYGGTLVEAEARIDRSPLATENANHRTDHAVVGALVCRTWRFAPTLVAAVRLHHELESLGGRSAAPEVHTLVAAGLVAEHLMRRAEGLPDDRDWREHADSAMQWLGVGTADLEGWELSLQPLFDVI
ncbi:HDOD domain-containing protein [Ideonella sp. A 288]|uniref:HDOD domain-containing protein n=1 Tax=Ideonella sp. A 288 TaxID=1962181 RepID=UPI000B4A7E93|nr:HDOD domain-containing protein [Ideonella sp. A 288]